MQKLKEKIDRKKQLRMWQTNVKLNPSLRQNSPRPFKFEESLRNYDNFPITNNSLKRLTKQYSSPFPDSQAYKKLKTESGGKKKEVDSKRKEMRKKEEENIKKRMKQSKFLSKRKEEERNRKRQVGTGKKQAGIRIEEEMVGKEKEKIEEEGGKKIEEGWISEEKSKSLEMTFRSVPSLTPIRYESDIKYPCRKFDFSELKEGLKTPEQIEANQFKEITMSEIKKDFEQLGKERGNFEEDEDNERKELNGERRENGDRGENDKRSEGKENEEEEKREQEKMKEENTEEKVEEEKRVRNEEKKTDEKWEHSDKSEEDQKKKILEQSKKMEVDTKVILSQEKEELEEETIIVENGEKKEKNVNSSKNKKKRIEIEDLHEYELAKEEGGSFFKYSLMRANKMQKKKFGKETMIVPVRSSRRIYSKMNKSFNEIPNVSLDLIGSEVGYFRNEVESEFPPLDAEAEKLREFLHHKDINLI